MIDNFVRHTAPAAAFVLLFGLGGCATPSGAPEGAGAADSNEGATLANRAGSGVASVLATAVYAPAKISYAAVGTVVGGGAYLASGANPEVANAVIGPAIDGDYIVTPDHLKDPASLEFVGRGYDLVRPAPVEEPGDALPDVAAAGSALHCTGLGTLPSVYFRSGGAELSSDALGTLGRATETLRECPWAGAEIRAYSDAMGARSGNLELARERAQAVRAYLVTSGVEADRLRLLTFGEEQPASTNSTRSGRAANRRVEVTLR